MLRRWIVDFGVHYEEGRATCEVPIDRLELQISAAKHNLERDPFMFSKAFGGDVLKRAIQTFDLHAGFAMVVYATLDAERCRATIEWCETRTITEEERAHQLLREALTEMDLGERQDGDAF